MAGMFQKWRQKLRVFFDNRGYTCDTCGREIFTYPDQRFCADCQGKLDRNDGLRCEKCGRKTVAEGICLTCKSVLPAFTRGFAPFVYRANTAALVNRIKNGKPRLASFFGEEMAAYFMENRPILLADGEKLLVLPIPLTQKRLKERGYNQAERLSEVVCRYLEGEGLSVEMDGEILEKVKETSLQKHMGLQGRQENVKDAYRVNKKKDCKGRSILLIDDIMTTGATTSECARRLLKAGAKVVYVLVAASLPERKIVE